MRSVNSSCLSAFTSSKLNILNGLKNTALFFISKNFKLYMCKSHFPCAQIQLMFLPPSSLYCMQTYFVCRTIPKTIVLCFYFQKGFKLYMCKSHFPCAQIQLMFLPPNSLSYLQTYFVCRILPIALSVSFLEGFPLVRGLVSRRAACELPGKLASVKLVGNFTPKARVNSVSVSRLGTGKSVQFISLDTNVCIVRHAR